MSDVEIWKPVVGWEGYYAVSSHGRMRSEERTIHVPASTSMRAYARTYQERILRLGQIKGYPFADLNRDGQLKRTMVHRLVAHAFLGECPDGFQVNHIDGAKTNNRVENLEYITAGENVRHSWRMGLSTRQCGERNARSTLTDDKVRYIRAMAEAKTRAELAQEMGVTTSCIWDIQKRRTWKHVE